MSNIYLASKEYSAGESSGTITITPHPGLSYIPIKIQVSELSFDTPSRILVMFFDTSNQWIEAIHVNGAETRNIELSGYPTPFYLSVSCTQGNAIVYIQASDNHLTASEHETERWSLFQSHPVDVTGVFKLGNDVLLYNNQGECWSFNGTSLNLLFFVPDRHKMGAFREDGLLYFVSSKIDSTPELYEWNPQTGFWKNLGVIDSNAIQCRMQVKYSNSVLFGTVQSGAGLKWIREWLGFGFSNAFQAESRHVGSWWCSPIVHNNILYWYEANVDRMHEWNGTYGFYDNIGLRHVYSMRSFQNAIYGFGNKVGKWDLNRFLPTLDSGHKFSYSFEQQSDNYAAQYFRRLYFGDESGDIYSLRNDIQFEGSIGEPIIGMAVIGFYLYAFTPTGNVYRRSFSFWDIFR